MWDLASLPGIEPGPPALGVQSIVSHWTSREALSTLTHWLPGLSEKQSLLIGAAQFAGDVTAALVVCGDGGSAWMPCCQGGGLELECPWHQSLPPVCFSILRRTLCRGGLCPEPTPDPKAGVRPSFLRGWVRGGGEGSEGGSRDRWPASEGRFHFLRQCRGAAYLFKQPQRKPFGQTVKFLNSLLPWCLNKVLPGPCVWSQGGVACLPAGQPGTLRPLQGQLLLAPCRRQPWRLPR